METSRPDLPKPDLPKNVRLKGVLVCDSLLRLFKISTTNFGGDLESFAVYLAVVSASVQAVFRDPLTRALYSGATPVPDDLRRAASRRAIAESVGLPRETVRRKIASLIASGHLVAEGDGVLPKGPILEHGGNLQFVLDVLAEIERVSVALRRADEDQSPRLAATGGDSA